MGLTALICAIILVIVIPNEIWAALFYLGLVLVVGSIGILAFTLWLSGL